MYRSLYQQSTGKKRGKQGCPVHKINLKRMEDFMSRKKRLFSGNIPTGEGWELHSRIVDKRKRIFHVYVKDLANGYLSIKLVLAEGESCKANYWMNVNKEKKCFTNTQQLANIIKKDFNMLKELAASFGIEVTKEKTK